MHYSKALIPERSKSTESPKECFTFKVEYENTKIEVSCTLNCISNLTLEHFITWNALNLKLTSFQPLSPYDSAMILYDSPQLTKYVGVISLQNIQIVMSNTFVGFSITNSITNEVVNCYFSSKSVMKEVFSLIESVNNPSLLIPSSTMKPIPLSSKVLKKRCEFSHSVVTEHDIFVGGILSDIIEYVLIHMGKLGIDSIALTGLICCLYEKNLFNEFNEEVKKLFIKYGKSYLQNSNSKTNTAWMNRIISFVDQYCRCYNIVSQKNREYMYELCCTSLEQDFPNILKYIRVYKPEREIIHVRQMHVAPRWNSSNGIKLQDFTPETIAEQLTCFESQLHLQIDLLDLIEGSGPTVSALTARWNHISSWVASSVLFESTPKGQLSILKFFIKVAEHLLELKNYSSCSQVIGGLKHHSIERLKKLDSMLSSKTKKKLKSLAKLFNPSGNFKKYRALPMGYPCIRFMPVFQKDIRFICDSNPLFIDKQKKVFNIERVVMMGECFSKMGLDYPEKSYTYDLQSNNLVQDFLSELRTISDDDLFSLSFSAEPSRGQSDTAITRKTNGSSGARNPLHKSAKLEKLLTVSM